jgi:hypothetical protein
MSANTVQSEVQEGSSGARMSFALWIGFGLLWLLGCASAPPQEPSPSRLAESLTELGRQVAPAEATLAAETAYAYSLQLAGEYRVVPPAKFHNMLVNLGIRHRGLCFQWADDLFAKLQSLNLQTLQLRRGIANFGNRSEHNSVVLTSCGQPFDQGIVLDAWRYSGHLYWGCVKKDPQFHWFAVEEIPEFEALLLARGLVVSLPAIAPKAGAGGAETNQ